MGKNLDDYRQIRKKLSKMRRERPDLYVPELDDDVLDRRLAQLDEEEKAEAQADPPDEE